MDLFASAGLFFTAAVLGVTHGIEPDHVAGITTLTQEARNSRLSALVGGCFGLGHAVLVVGWVVGAYLLFGTTAFPPVFEQFGLLLVGLILTLLSLYLGITGTRKLVHRHLHDHDHGPHAHYHLHLPLGASAGSPDHGDHEHDHGVLAFLKIGTVGAMFTLSPPVSMLAFISVALPGREATLVAGLIVTYTVVIVATMASVGVGVGTVFSLSRDRGERLHAVSQVAASVLVLAFAANVLWGVVPTLLS